MPFVQSSAFHSVGTGGQTKGDLNMKMNRRNALLGLGAIATGGGALFGSGAFSQVSATRDVTIGVQSDDASTTNLQLVANGSGPANNSSNGNGNELGINASNINTDASTKYDSVFDVTNNGGGTRYIEIDASAISGTVELTFYLDDDLYGSLSNDVVLTANDGTPSQYITMGDASTAFIGMEIVTADGDAGTTLNGSIDINAYDDTADADSGTEAISL